MRIVSQDGTIDVPYEMVAIQRFRTDIYFLNKNLTGVEQLINDMEIASYSNEVKAQKAMEMLRKAYCGLPVIMKNVDISDEVISMLKDLKKNGIVFQKLDETPSVEYVSNTIFQFPKDEDIEV